MMTNDQIYNHNLKIYLFDNLIADNEDQIMQQRLTVDAISPFPHIFSYITVGIFTKKYLTKIQN